MKKIQSIKKIAAVSLVLIAASYAGNIHAHDNTKTTTTTTERTVVKNNITDQEVAKKINDKIGPGWFSKGYDTVRVQVNNGVVTLDGSVKTNHDKEKVEKEVRDIDGVKSLISNISVLDPASKESKQEFAQDKFASPADEQLNQKIRDKVSRGWLWDSYKKVTLDTSNGVVTLKGNVDSLRDQDKLVAEIRKVEGVKEVKSDLTIKDHV